jgi:hypothetical protein
MNNRFRIAAILAAANLAAASEARAQDTPGADASVGSTATTAAELPSQSTETPSSRFHADAEVDPTAYALSGYSLHVGLGYGHVRLEWGAFAADIPKFVHGNDGFKASAHGFGGKLQYFFLAAQRGPFAGLDAAVQRTLIEREGTDLAREQVGVRLGIHAGYRIALPAGFYATPWVGVSYGFGARDVELGGTTYKNNPIIVFPAIHLGYRFQ